VIGVINGKQFLSFCHLYIARISIPFIFMGKRFSINSSHEPKFHFNWLA
jgi:hypothetical protein